MKYGFVYLWYDRRHRRYYVGAHWGAVDDGYVCSSSWMKPAFKRRPEDFKRRILKTGIESKKDMFLEEWRWLRMIRPEELGRRYYNLNIHYHNPWFQDDDRIAEVGAKLSERIKKLHIEKRVGMHGRKHSASTREKMSRSAKERGGSHLVGRVVSDRTRQKISDANLGRTPSVETRQLISQNHHDVSGSKNPMHGRKRPDSSERLRKVGKTKLTCPLCGGMANAGNMKRWHGVNRCR